MTHLVSFDKLRIHDAWLTIGVFDGVHRGHQIILRHLIDGAHRAGCTAVVLTFHPHPAITLSDKNGFKCLTTPEERYELLESLGVDIVVTQTFDLALTEETAENYMRCISKLLDLRRLLIGYDFALGHGREGNATRLIELGKLFNYDVEVIKPVKQKGKIVSSTEIRAQITAGQVAEAALLLGRCYTVSGLVVHGDGRGQRIGIPTANIQADKEKLIPARGVYACFAITEGKQYKAVANVGIRPTFEKKELIPIVEAHLLDFNKNLYDLKLTLQFVTRLRDETIFPSYEYLVEQIMDDISRARQILI